MPTKEISEEDLIVPESPEAVSFVKGLIASRQAAKANKDGSLPPGTTHEIVGQAKTGLPILRRPRFAGIV
jgi:hypothetical protein